MSGASPQEVAIAPEPETLPSDHLESEDELSAVKQRRERDVKRLMALVGMATISAIWTQTWRLFGFLLKRVGMLL